MSKTYKFSNKEIVIMFKEVLAAMEVKNYNYYRIRAYQNVITVIEGLTMSVYHLWENNRLDEIPGIGGAIKRHLEELFKTGKVVEHEAIKHDLPEGMFALLGLRGIGAKKAYKLAKAFTLDKRETALDVVSKAAENQEIRELEGFAEKSEQLILESVTELKKTKKEKKRTLLIRAEDIADRIISYLKDHPEIQDAIALGSLRRRNPTIGDLDIAIETTNSEVAMNYFLKFSEIDEVLVSGDKRVSVVLANGMQVDIRVCTKENYGSMIQYFTGSKAHNIVLRTFALDRGYSLSEYGIKKGGKLHEFSNEEDFYKFLKLPHIPPESRQGKHEVELAAKNKLPKLVEIADIKGDIHTHTIASDGVNTINEMVKEAINIGYQYLGISDHTPSMQSRGRKEVEKIIETTREVINKLNKSQDKIKVLFGYEVNIFADATLSLPDEILMKLDYAFASIHSAFNQDRETITNRMLVAIENPYINIIGHPSGRLINEREPCDIDWRRFFSAVKENSKIVEINAQPDRLDLTEDLVNEALNRGIDLLIGTDAHSTEQLHYMKYGIDVARRGWCEVQHVANTLDYDEFLELLAKGDVR